MAEYTPKYTTGDIVSGAISEFDITISGGQIDEYIRQSEGLIEAVMQTRTTDKFTFDEDKHGLIRGTATALAAYKMIQYNPSTFKLREKVALMVDMLWAEGMRGLSLLSNPSVRKWLDEV